MINTLTLYIFIFLLRFCYKSDASSHNLRLLQKEKVLECTTKDNYQENGIVYDESWIKDKSLNLGKSNNISCSTNETIFSSVERHSQCKKLTDLYPHSDALDNYNLNECFSVEFPIDNEGGEQDRYGRFTINYENRSTFCLNSTQLHTSPQVRPCNPKSSVGNPTYCTLMGVPRLGKNLYKDNTSLTVSEFSIRTRMKTKNTCLVSTVGDTAIKLHTRNYCPVEPVVQHLTALVPYHVKRFAVLGGDNAQCEEKKGMLYKVERRFKSAIKKAKQDNERILQSMLEHFSKELDELKLRNEKKLMIYRKSHFNEKSNNRLYGFINNTGILYENYIHTNESTAFKVNERNTKIYVSKLESKSTNLQRINLKRAHKFEKILFREQLEMEKYNLIQTHKTILRNFDSLQHLKYQFKNMSLHMQEGEMLWKLDDMRRKSIYALIKKTKDEIKENEMRLQRAKNVRKKIRKYIKEQVDIRKSYYKLKRKRLYEDYYYKTFISDKDMFTYTSLLEQLNEREERDFNKLKYSTRQFASEARGTINDCYVFREVYSHDAKEKLRDNKRFLKEYAKWNEMDYQTAKAKVLQETENNIADERSKLLEQIELEFANFQNKSDVRIAELSTKHTTELKELDELL